MSKKRQGRDGTLGFGLRLLGTQEDDQWRSKKNTIPKPKQKQSVPKLPESGAGSLMGGKKAAIGLPENFYPPVGAESIDIRRLINVPANQTTELLIMSYTAQTAQAITWYKYGIFTDALDASLIQFFPRINGKRILRYHGDPQNGYALNLSVGPNLNDSNLITTQLYMKPNDVLTWHVVNNDVVVNPMGVRMVGYVDSSLKRKTMSFGG